MIEKGRWHTTAEEKEIYKLKDKIILDYAITKNKIIEDKGRQTTISIQQGNIKVRRHISDRVKKQLRNLWLLKK